MPIYINGKKLHTGKVVCISYKYQYAVVYDNKRFVYIPLCDAISAEADAPSELIIDYMNFCQTYSVDRLHELYGHNSYFEACLYLLTANKLKSSFERSCRDQLTLWLKSPKLKYPLTEKQIRGVISWMYFSKSLSFD